MAKQPARRKPTVPPPPVGFRLVFITAIGLSVLSLLCGSILSALPNHWEGTKEMIDACATGWKAGLGAITGMILGRKLP